jgi:hypothetical protein
MQPICATRSVGAFMVTLEPRNRHYYSGADPFDYLTELQRNHIRVRAAPGDWMPWNYREQLSATAPSEPSRGPPTSGQVLTDEYSQRLKSSDGAPPPAGVKRFCTLTETTPWLTCFPSRLVGRTHSPVSIGIAEINYSLQPNRNGGLCLTFAQPQQRCGSHGYSG